jgi:hypothetical protein
MPIRPALCLCLFAAPAAAADPPAVGRLDPAQIARFKAGDAFDQEVVVARRSAFNVLGADLGSAAKYAFASRLTVTAVDADGRLAVSQAVRSAKLLDADPGARPGFEAALKSAVGRSFEFAVTPAGEVAEFRAPADPVRVEAGPDRLGQRAVRVWSLLDADGWKELAGLTFFRPAAGGKWSRPAAHDWGPLGRWAGKTAFTAAGKRGAAERYDYALDLTYLPPAAGGDGPVRVTKAAFRPVAAGGAILYDAARGRVSAAEETFRVRGTAVVAAAGGEGVVEMEEEQVFQLRVVDPVAHDLTGRPRR